MQHLRVWHLVGLCVVLLALTIQPVVCASNVERVVTLGADLSDEQRNSILRVFNIPAGADLRQITVTNAEERALLGDDLPAEVIGSKAISSALVELLGAGEGIKVERYNITFVTPAMYGNALVTAGVRDARIVVAAPTPVSGTAALTGIFKGFEKATGHQLTPEAKETAGDELITTGELARQIGESKASELMARVKERVVGENLQDPASIRNVVSNVAQELQVKLSTQQINQVTNVIVRISHLQLEAAQPVSYLAGLRESVEDLASSKQVKSWFQQILDFFLRLFNRLFASLTG